MRNNKNKIAGLNPAIHRLLSQIRGFTLIELIASLVLLGLLTSIFGMGLVAAMKSHEFSRANVQMAQKGQLAMARITWELMELTSIEAIADTAAGQDPFIIYNRLPTIGNQPESRFAIHYHFMDGALRLYTNLDPTIMPPLDAGTINNGDILADGVAGFSLNYFSQGSSVWTWGSDPRRLSTIGIAIQLRRPDDPNRTQNFNTLVHLRNTDNFGGAAPGTPASINDYSCFVGTLWH